MAKARKVKEISLTMANKVGLLLEVTSALAKAKINITALCAYAMESTAYFMMTTEGHAKAKKVLASLGAKVEEKDVVAVEIPNKTGELEKVAKRIADAGIDIEYMYGTAGTGKTAVGVLKTVDDGKAIRAINK